MVEVMSRCPVCGARVNVGAGDPTPAHEAEGPQSPCPGIGKPTQ